MAGQDSWKRITLRLPDDLHAKLTADAEEDGRSLNAQIIHALSFYAAYDRNSDVFVTPEAYPEDLQEQAEMRADYLLREIKKILEPIGIELREKSKAGRQPQGGLAKAMREHRRSKN